MKTLMIIAAATSILRFSPTCDEFGKDGTGLRCYTGDFLAELRNFVAKGKLKDLPQDAKAIIENASTIAIVIDFRKAETKEESKLVVGSVKEKSSKVVEFKTYTSSNVEFDVFLRLFEVPKH